MHHYLKRIKGESICPASSKYLPRPFRWENRNGICGYGTGMCWRNTTICQSGIFATTILYRMRCTRRDPESNDCGNSAIFPWRTTQIETIQKWRKYFRSSTIVTYHDLVFSTRRTTISSYQGLFEHPSTSMNRSWVLISFSWQTVFGFFVS